MKLNKTQELEVRLKRASVDANFYKKAYHKAMYGWGTTLHDWKITNMFLVVVVIWMVIRLVIGLW